MSKPSNDRKDLHVRLKPIDMERLEFLTTHFEETVSSVIRTALRELYMKHNPNHFNQLQYTGK